MDKKDTIKKPIGKLSESSQDLPGKIVLEAKPIPGTPAFIEETKTPKTQ